jgi:hypothetical protein
VEGLTVAGNVRLPEHQILALPKLLAAARFPQAHSGTALDYQKHLASF